MSQDTKKEIVELILESDNCSQIGQHKRAIEVGMHALDLATQHLGPDDPLCGTIMNNLAVSYLTLGDGRNALPLANSAVRIRRKVYDGFHPEYIISLNNLAMAYSTIGDHKTAAASHRNILALRRQVLGNSHLDTAVSLNNLAMVLVELNDVAGAEPLLEEALDIKRRILGEKDPSFIKTLKNLTAVQSLLKPSWKFWQ